jgi:predicted ATPase
MGNLLADSSPIVGRLGELAEARRRLSDGARLLTLIGTGGVGKTRLAKQLAGDVQWEFRDGVWLVDLAELADDVDGELVAQAVASVFGLRDQSARPCVETLGRSLQERSLLLVLDNCEHLIDACAGLVDRLLRAAADVRIVTTSRQPLNLIGEQILEVPPLPVPEDPTSPEEMLAQFPAVRLFIDRAISAAPTFRLTQANCATVARLCQRLEGLPLAIELAAARLRTLSLKQVLKKLDDRDDPAAQAWPDGRSRHRTVRATIDWSYSLCTPEARALWSRLAVFPGEFDLSAAEAICSDDSIAPDDVLLLVAELVNQSLLCRVKSSGPARYKMLGIIREYGYERLVEAGEESAFRHRHCAYYHTLSLQVEPASFDSRQGEWLRRMRREAVNLRAAIGYALSTPGQERTGLEVGAAIAEYWIFLGRLGEARHWLTRALRQGPKRGAARAKALLVAAWIAAQQGDTATAAALLDACRAESQDLDDRGGLARVAGVLAFYQGDCRGSIDLLEQALQRCRTGADAPANAFLALLFRAAAASFLGDARAGAFITECLDRAEAAGAEWVDGVGFVGRRTRALECGRHAGGGQSVARCAAAPGRARRPMGAGLGP